MPDDCNLKFRVNLRPEGCEFNSTDREKMSAEGFLGTQDPVFGFQTLVRMDE